MAAGAARCTPLSAALFSVALSATAVPLAAAQGTAAPRPAPAAAHGLISGTVTDTNLRAIGAAEVLVVGTSFRLAAGDDGRFRILDMPSGEFLLFVRHVGFRPATTVVHVDPGDTLRLAFTLEPALTELGTVTITEKARSPKMAEFDERRKAGFGEFLDQAQIEKLNFPSVGGVLRTFKSVRVVENGPGGSVSSAREPIGRYGGSCPLQIYLDGIPRGPSLADLPSPKLIAAVEVYAGPATTPVWLPSGGSGGKRICGVILIWTRDGS